MKSFAAAFALLAWSTGCSGNDASPAIFDAGGGPASLSGTAGVPSGAASGGGAGGGAGPNGGAGTGLDGAGNNGIDLGGNSAATAGMAGSFPASGGAGTNGGMGSSGGAAGASPLGGSGGVGGTAAAFSPCPESGPCRVLPLGDSITDGLTVPGGYRIHLFELANQNGKNITYVGGSMNGPQMVAGKPFPRAHEGHSGWTIAQVDAIVPTPALQAEPHVVLLHLGTNDMYQGAAMADVRLGALIDQILEALPNSLLVVSTIIPFPGAPQSVTTYNSAIPKVVEERARAGKHVLLADQFKGFPTAELADGVHPNAEGYARMAEVWYAAVSPYLR